MSLEPPALKTSLRHLCVCVAAWSVVASTSAGQASGPLPAAPQTVVAWLDAYAAGRYDQVVQELQRTTDFKDILEQLKRDGPGWIAAAGPAEVDRRELVAATFALEATRASIGQPWKLLLKAPSDGVLQIPGYTLYWEAPPLILEWACARLRARSEMHPAERWW